LSKIGVMERTGSLRALLVEREESFRSLLSDRTASLEKKSLISPLLERTDSLRSMATPIVERALSVRNRLFVREKSVTFGEIHMNRVHRILNRDDYSNQELDAAFYWRGDYDCMKKKRRRAEDLLQRSEQVVTGKEADDEDEDTDCVHGLATKAEADTRNSLITKSVVAVLVEQEMQWNDDQTPADPVLLAKIYIEFSASSRKEAHERALQLEAGVRSHIAPCRWSPAFKRRNSTMGTPEPRRQTFERQISTPVTSAAPIQPVRETSFRWKAPKLPIRELSIIWKPKQHHQRPTFAKQMSAPLGLSSAAPIQPVRESSFEFIQPVRETSFRRRAPKELPIRELSTVWNPDQHHQRPTFAKHMAAPLGLSAAPIQPVRESSFECSQPAVREEESSFESFFKCRHQSRF
jgi:hypothetical protein